VPIEPVAETRVADVPLYLTDTALVSKELGWAPTRTAEEIVGECVRWIADNRAALEGVFVAGS
jgi:nucleoside-diphosphate-sugar epimerase